MSELEKLLTGVEVAYKTVDEIFNVKNGYTPSKRNKEFWSNGTIPWFRMEDLRKNGRVLSDSIQHVSDSAVKGNLIPENSLIMSTTATLGEHALVLVPYLTNQQITNFYLKETYINTVDIKFLFYCFFDFGKWCVNNANKNGGMSIIGIKKLKQYEIPIPCPDNPEKSLKIQKEIVRILDDFTELTTELTEELYKELSARKKQYNYYREQLLTFEKNEVFSIELNEIAEYSKKRISFDKIDETNYVGVDNLLQNREGKTFSTRVPVKGNSTKYEIKDILIGNIRPYLKKIWFSNCIGGTNGDVLVIHIVDSRIKPEFLYHVLADDKFFEYNMQHAKGAKMPRGNKVKIMEYLIPIPSLEEQESIVSILDKFDAFSKSISEDLPKEIELRKKQYEYYRNKLLTFPKDTKEA